MMQAFHPHAPPFSTATGILEALLHPVLAVDGGVYIRTFNAAAVPYLNGAREDVTGAPLAAVLKVLTNGGDPPGLAAMVSGVMDPEGPPNARMEATLLRRDGGEVPARITVSSIPGDPAGGALVVIEDLSDLHRRHSQLSIQARHDPLTGLINREEFTTRLERLLERSAEQRWTHSLCFMDLDQFKSVNDSAGHAAGDELLRQVTTALLNRVRGRDTLARFGGDEFAILLEHCPLEEAREVAEKLRQTVADFVFEWEGQRFGVGASIGLVPITAHHQEAGRVMSMADAACYQAKNAGRNRVCVLESEDDADGPRMVETLRRALAEDSLLLYAQAILDMNGDEPVVRAREVLLRLPTGGGIASPHEFVPATRHRLNVEMDRWVLQRLTSRPILGGDQPLLVNVSAASIQDPAFVEAIAAGERCAARLCFDITETTLLEAGAAITPFCDAVRRRGWDLALALRCEGPSAICLLEALRPDFLTLDVRPLIAGHRPFRRRLAERLLELGRLVDATTVATHVENTELLAITRDLDFDWAQGYLLGSPEPLVAEV
ncbi:MAG: diguanylate cyclase [Gammaproteobacteria bacterium]|nr:diguanylate cyclase [Gammaproteobacteria bacterium]